MFNHLNTYLDVQTQTTSSLGEVTNISKPEKAQFTTFERPCIYRKNVG